MTATTTELRTAAAKLTDPTLLDFFDYYLGHHAAKAAETNAAQRVDLGYNPESLPTLVAAAKALNAAGARIWVALAYGRLTVHAFPAGAEVSRSRYGRAEILVQPAA